MKTRQLLATSLLLLPLAATPLRAGPAEVDTVERSAAVLQALAHQPLRCIPPALLCDAQGVAVFPHVVKVGFVVDRRFGRGVLLVRKPDGSWSNPVFVDLEGGGIGLEAGVEATDLVLVFKSPSSLDHILKGKGRLALGSDVSIAAGPVGREAEVASDRRLKPDVFSYSHSRGLFAGLSLAGLRVQVDGHANEAFYGLRGCGPGDVLAQRCPALGAVVGLHTALAAMSAAPAPSVIVVPPPPAVPPPHGTPWHY
jgi:lipid-binding SYLF domain-containing protein